jgi:coniferyl-aldehyde dehydrogenase
MDTLERTFHLQQAAVRAEGAPPLAVRRDRLTRAIDLLVSSQHALCAALSADFGQRPAEISRFLDILPAVRGLKLARRRLHHWMRPRRTPLGLPLPVPGAVGHIEYQPLGVVGVISPWNFPLTLSFGPLAGIFAAGNRCLIKPSEIVPATAELMKELVARHFEPNELAVVTGGAEVAAAFSRLPFDHLLFTGSEVVGRKVISAAAEHLVPVTLELGGKCPVVVGRSAKLAQVVDRVMMAKMANAAQICLAPDYMLLPEECLQDFTRAAQAWVARAYPGLPVNSDCTGIVSARHARRAAELVADARAHGAQLVSLTTGSQAVGRVMAPVLISRVTEEMRVMREEIFAPVLPIKTYKQIDDAIAYINDHPPPLALYYFGAERSEAGQVIARTRSGGVTVNDIGMHFFAEELPFGGLGASGMGAYHGEHGFRRFSHARPVLRMPRWDFAGLLGLRPPYGTRLKRWLDVLIRR